MFHFSKLFERDWYWRKYRRFVSHITSANRLKHIDYIHRVKTYYESRVGRRPHLCKWLFYHKMDINDKLLWLSLYWQNPLVPDCADKFKMRRYVTETCKLPNSLLVPLIGIWNNEKEINFESLPNKFVLKCNHGCNFNIICQDKESLDCENARRQLGMWLNTVYDGNPLQPHYIKITPHVIMCEQYLPHPNGLSSITDYKIHCFNGKPQYILVCFNRDQVGTPQRATFDLHWNQLFYTVNEQPTNMDKPFSLDLMIEYSRIMAVPFPFVRIDFYEVDQKPLLSELTFTPSGNIITSLKKELLIKIGKSLKLPARYKNNMFI